LIVVVFYVFQIPLLALLDSVVMELVKKTGQVYGRQRLWGSIGFILSSFGLGQLVSVSNLALVFQINAAFLAIGCGFLSLLLPLERSSQINRIRDGLRQLAGQRQAVAFFAANTLLGVGAVSFLNFLGLHVLSLGGNESQVGLAYAVKALLEIPVMYLGARWFARYSYGRMIVTGYLGFSAVWLLIASAASTVQLIGIISLMGIAYAIYWVAAVGHASQIAPEGLAATAQSLVAATHYGLGGGLGAVAAGYIWDVAGGSAVILFAAGMAALAAIIFYGGNR
jgi:PPP family 3-phenylpropionic acid transporter